VSDVECRQSGLRQQQQQQQRVARITYIAHITGGSQQSRLPGAAAQGPQTDAGLLQRLHPSRQNTRGRSVAAPATAALYSLSSFCCLLMLRDADAVIIRPHRIYIASWSAGYCYGWSGVVCAFVSVLFFTTVRALQLQNGRTDAVWGRLVWAEGTMYWMGCKLAQPSEYDIMACDVAHSSLSSQRSRPGYLY